MIIKKVLETLSAECAVTIHLIKRNDGKASIIFVPAIKTITEDKIKFAPIMVTDQLDVIEEALLKKVEPFIPLLNDAAKAVSKLETSLIPKVKKNDNIPNTETKVVTGKVTNANTVEQHADKSEPKEAEKEVSKHKNNVVKDKPKQVILPKGGEAEHCVACSGTGRNSQDGSCLPCHGTGIKQEQRASEKAESAESSEAFEGNLHGAVENGNTDKLGVSSAEGTNKEETKSVPEVNIPKEDTKGEVTKEGEEEEEEPWW